MKLFTSTLSAAALASLAAADPAGKFSANYGKDTVDLVSIVGGGAAELLAQVKPPGGKNLLIGLSGMVNILTSTGVTAGNKGDKESAEAEAGVDVTIKYTPAGDHTAAEICDGTVLSMTAAPGKVTLSARRQKLEVELDLDCTVDIEGNIPNTCTIDGDLYVSLALETTAAHHFNFIANGGEDGLDTILYDVVACFDLSKDTDVTDGGVAEAYVGVQKRMLTVQQVQATQNKIIDV